MKYLTLEFCENVLAVPETLPREQKKTLNLARTGILATCSLIIERGTAPTNPTPFAVFAGQIGEQLVAWGDAFEIVTGYRYGAPETAHAGGASS